MSAWGSLAALSAPGWGALVSGVLPFLQAFPFFALLPWLAFIVPLRWVRRQVNVKMAFYGGFWLGLVYGGLYCLWFFDLHPLTWLGFSDWESRLVTLAGWGLLAVENGLLLGALCAVYWALPGAWFRVLLFPAIWVGVFALLNATPLALPWTLLEYTQAPLPVMRWLMGLVSGSGLTGLMVLHTVCWAEWTVPNPRTRASQKARQWPSKPTSWKKNFPYVMASFWQHPLSKGLLVPLLIVILSLFWTRIAPEPKAPWPLPVAIVQANLPIEVIRSGFIAPNRIEAAYIAPVLQRVLPAGTLLAYPEEGVVPGWVRETSPQNNPFLARLLWLACTKRVYISVGVSLFDTLNNRHYNALALLPASGDVRAIRFYRKRRLVPFGEYTPYQLGERLSALLKTWSIDYQSPFEAGRDSPLLSAGRARLGGLVCFELIDALPGRQGYAWQYKTQGANLLINASNLGWFHENPLLEAQFTAIAQVRAAETRLPLVVASNTGISALISASGKILRRSHFQKQDRTQTQIIFYNGQ
jgi:apolipoprotein N-acyltransferase